MPRVESEGRVNPPSFFSEGCHLGPIIFAGSIHHCSAPLRPFDLRDNPPQMWREAGILQMIMSVDGDHAALPSPAARSANSRMALRTCCKPCRRVGERLGRI